MMVDSTTPLFLDASCLIAAAASPSSGSAFIWSLCERGLLTAVVSQAVLEETEANLVRKFAPHCLDQHSLQLAQGVPQVAPVARLDISPRLYPSINPKDEHVVVAAIATHCPLILTLDQPLATEINAADLTIWAVSPKEFITTILPTHPAFDRMRD
jgi:predicted nucleic acid-binding protein